MKIVDTLGIIRQMESDPGLRAQLRAVLLGDEMLELPAVVRELASHGDDLAEAQRRTETLLATLVETTDRLADAQLRTESAVGDLRGFALEFRLHLNPRRYIPRALATARRLVVGEELDAVMSGLDESVVADVERADAFVAGRRPDGEAILFVVEAAWRAHVDDVERAERRARPLRESGAVARALVVSQVEPGDAVLAAASSLGVAVVTESGGLLTSGRSSAA